MRKLLLTLATITVLAGLFVGSWFVTGMLRGEEAAPGIPSDSSALVTDTADNTTTDDVEGSLPTTSTVNLSFPLPADMFAFESSLYALMSQFGANSFAISRVFTYASVATHETLNSETTPTFISEKAVAQGRDQGLLAAGAVAVELLDNPLITELVDAWEGELTPATAAVVAAVVAFADADGYDATAAAEAPTFDGEFGWKSGGTRDGIASGYEPAYGQTRTIAIDPAACPVDAAPLGALRSERAALTSVDTNATAPVIVAAARFSTVAFLYMVTTSPQQPEQSFYYEGLNLGVALHDALIATWRANWENGVAAPIDIFAGDDTALRSSYPSYPSWTDVAVSASETYVSGVLGQKVTMDTMIDFLLENHKSDEYKGQLKILRENLANSANTAHHWNVDREAGRKLGNCIAGEALKLRSK